MHRLGNPVRKMVIWLVAAVCAAVAVSFSITGWEIPLRLQDYEMEALVSEVERRSEPASVLLRDIYATPDELVGVVDQNLLRKVLPERGADFPAEQNYVFFQAKTGDLARDEYLRRLRGEGLEIPEHPVGYANPAWWFMATFVLVGLLSLPFVFRSLSGQVTDKASE